MDISEPQPQPASPPREKLGHFGLRFAARRLEGRNTNTQLGAGDFLGDLRDLARARTDRGGRVIDNPNNKDLLARARQKGNTQAVWDTYLDVLERATAERVPDHLAKEWASDYVVIGKVLGMDQNKEYQELFAHLRKKYNIEPQKTQTNFFRNLLASRSVRGALTGLALMGAGTGAKIAHENITQEAAASSPPAIAGLPNTPTAGGEIAKLPVQGAENTATPTSAPTAAAAATAEAPTPTPSSTAKPTEAPTVQPSPIATAEPTPSPTVEPTPAPTVEPAPQMPQVELGENAGIIKDVVFPAVYKDVLAIRDARRTENEQEYDKRIIPEINKGRVNILLGGVGSEVYTSNEVLTDMIKIVSISEDNTYQVITLPRDAYDPVLKDRINTAYQHGSTIGGEQAGFDLQRKILEEATGLSIDITVMADFDAFKKIVGTVFGKVRVNVPQEISEYTTEGGGVVPGFKAGEQDMDAATLLQYISTRKSSPNGEDDRTTRQSEVIKLLKDTWTQKFRQASFPDKLGMLKDIAGTAGVFKELLEQKHIRSDYDIIKILNLLPTGTGGFLQNLLEQREIKLGMPREEDKISYQFNSRPDNFMSYQSELKKGGLGIPEGVVVPRRSALKSGGQLNQGVDYWKDLRDAVETMILRKTIPKPR